MTDKSHRACPDHPCDRCSVCRAGRCCGNDSPAPSQTTIDQTAEVLLEAMRHMTIVSEQNRSVVWALQADTELVSAEPAPATAHDECSVHATHLPDTIVDAEIISDSAQLTDAARLALPQASESDALIAEMTRSEVPHDHR